jgi:hypothetical protein
MKKTNGRLVVLVASIAVAAVVIGGVLASRQAPHQDGPDAAPLPTQSGTPASTPAPSPAPTPGKAPSSTPTAPSTPKPPTTTPATPGSGPTYTGPTSITLNAAKLSKGRDPQLPYVVGREVRGGAGATPKVPGTEAIYQVGRLGNSVLAVVAKGEGTELLRLGDESIRRTAGVSSLVTAADQSAAAYAVSRPSSLGAATKGGVVYSESSGSVQSLKVPNGWNIEVLAHAGGKVYFRSGDTVDGAWKLYSWTPGAATAQVKPVVSPTAVSDDGRVAASAGVITDGGSCSTISEVATGKQLWRTCDNMIRGFTPDGGTAIGGPAYPDGYCDVEQAALNAQNGKLVREWKGCFHSITAEDDQHFLIVAVVKNAGEENASRAIVRCDFTNGECELATQPYVGNLILGS